MASRNAAYDFTPAAHSACAKDSSRARRAALRAARVLPGTEALSPRAPPGAGAGAGPGAAAANATTSRRVRASACANARARRSAARRVGGAGAERAERASRDARVVLFLSYSSSSSSSSPLNSATELNPSVHSARLSGEGAVGEARRGGARVADRRASVAARSGANWNARFRSSRARAACGASTRDAQGEAGGAIRASPAGFCAPSNAARARSHAAPRRAARKRSDRLLAPPLPSSARVVELLFSVVVVASAVSTRRSTSASAASDAMPPNTLPAATSSATPASHSRYAAASASRRIGTAPRVCARRAARAARRAVSSRGSATPRNVSTDEDASASRPTRKASSSAFSEASSASGGATEKAFAPAPSASVPVAEPKTADGEPSSASVAARSRGRARSRSARRASSVEFVLSRDEKSAETSAPQLTRVAKSSREVVAPASNPSSSRSASNPPEDSDSKTSGLPKHATSTPGTRRASRHTAASARATPSAPSSGDLICPALLSAARTQTRRVCRNTLSARSALRFSTATSAASASATSSARLAFEFV